MPTSPISTSRRTVSGRTVLLISAVFVVVLAGILGGWMIYAKPKAGAYIDVLALDDRTVVAVRQEVTDDHDFIELIDVDKGEAGLRWQALVPGYHVGPGAIGLAANDNAVTARFPRSGETQIFGFATATAEKLGTIELGQAGGEDTPDQDDGAMAPNIASISAGTMSYEVLQPNGRPTRIYAINLSNGTIAWKVDLPVAGVTATWVSRSHLYVEQPGKLVALDREGNATVYDTDIACAIPGDPDLLALGTADGFDIYQDGVKAEHRDGHLAGVCGMVDHAPRFVTDPDVAVGDRVNDSAALPVRVLPKKSADGTFLDGGTWRSHPSHDLDGATVLDAGVAILVRAGDVLASIDPVSGKAHAVRVAGTRPLSSHHLAGGVVWIVGDRGIVGLDAATLAPRGTWHEAPAVVTADDALTGLGLY